MSKRTEQPNLDKTEQQRLEREARINRLKGKDGQKKKIKTTNRLMKIITPIVIAVVLIVAVVWGAFSLGLVHRFVSPMSVGSEKISMVEYNYHYNTYLQTYNYYASIGYAPADANGNLDIDAATGLTDMEDLTWGEYLHNITQESLQQVVAYADAAEDKSMTLTDESNESIDQFFASINTAYATDLERSNYYESVYGRGANENTLRPVLERTMMANQFASEYPDTFEFTDAEIEAYYDENKDTYDSIEYRLFNIKVPEADEDATEEEEEALVEETEAKADEMLAALTDFDSMKEVVLDYVDEDKKDYEIEDKTLYQNGSYSSIGSTAIRDWLFDDEREHNDKEVINSGTNYYVVVYGERGRSDDAFPTVRHILFEAREATATDEELAEAKEAAEEALAKITDEESMIELSEELLEEEAAAEAKIYENVARAVMVEEFEDWIYDVSNKPGDTGIVKTSYGYHVMYLVSRNEDPIWYENIVSALRTAQFQEEAEAIVDNGNYELKINTFGVKLAG